ncbi:proline dehydrogenase family protein [Arsenicicoccus dermatophilus]|uniref:proline dehydrogenase family protein n=1 Tax=Arsenicicoccus dermatophilus TaxID=1076331 RepID=UPI003916E721
MLDPADSLRLASLRLARVHRVQSVIEESPGTREVLARYIAGDATRTAVDASRDLMETGRDVTVAYLGPDADTRANSDATVAEHLRLVEQARERGLTRGRRFELSVRPAAFGRLDQTTGQELALAQLRRVVRAAHNAGVETTLDMEGLDSVEPTMRIADALRADLPTVGVTVQAALLRAEGDCELLADSGARVRLVKSAYTLHERGTFDAAPDVDRSYARCLAILMRGDAYPMVATHDPRLTDLAERLARATGRGRRDYEHQMYLGIRPLEQTSLADRGMRMRVYVPYGPSWYSYLVQRVAERPTNVTFFLRSLLTRR